MTPPESVHLPIPSFESQTFLHRGLELRYCTWKSTEPTERFILFLHGWLDCAAAWDATAQILGSKGYTCLAIDHRGHGQSAHIADYDEYHFADYISDLQAWIEHLLGQEIITENFILVGHSMGGTIASMYSALCKHHPYQLVLIDGLGPKHETPEEATHRFRQHLLQRSRPSTHRTMSLDAACKKIERAHPFLAAESRTRFTLQQITRSPSQADASRYEWRWDARHRNKSAIGFSLPRFIDMLQHIPCPTHVIFGKHSWYLQLPDIPTRLKAIPHLKHNVLLPSGHSPHLECPALLATAIDTSLNTL